MSDPTLLTEVRLLSFTVVKEVHPFIKLAPIVVRSTREEKSALIMPDPNKKLSGMEVIGFPDKIGLSKNTTFFTYPLAISAVAAVYEAVSDVTVDGSPTTLEIVLGSFTLVTLYSPLRFRAVFTANPVILVRSKVELFVIKRGDLAHDGNIGVVPYTFNEFTDEEPLTDTTEELKETLVADIGNITFTISFPAVERSTVVREVMLERSSVATEVRDPPTSQEGVVVPAPVKIRLET